MEVYGPLASYRMVPAFPGRFLFLFNFGKVMDICNLALHTCSNPEETSLFSTLKPKPSELSTRQADGEIKSASTRGAVEVIGPLASNLTVPATCSWFQSSFDPSFSPLLILFVFESRGDVEICSPAPAVQILWRRLSTADKADG